MAATLLLATAARAQTTDVALGIEALARRDVKGAEAAFRRGTTADNPLVRPAAWQWLGHVAWKFRGDTAAAQRYIDRALAGARDSSQILLETARLQGFRRRYREAVGTAVDAMRRSGDAERRGAAARLAVELCVERAFSAAPNHLRDSVDSKVVGELRDSMLARAARFPGRTVDAAALIDAAALANDSAGIRKGLLSYFALVDDGIGTTLMRNIARSAPLDGLVFGGLYESFVLQEETRQPREPLEASGEAIAYGRFLHDVRRSVEGVYRAEANGTARPGDVQRAINARGRGLWEKLHDAAVEPYYPSALAREMGQTFGGVMTIERSRGMDELFLARRLGTYQVADAPIVVLDGVVSSGIDEWYLDGTGGRAGWVANDTIYERRTGFTETPFRAWLALTDPQTIPGDLFRISRDSIGDIDRAKRDSLGYFPSVAARMFRSGAQTLLDSLQTSEAFTRAMYENLVHSSIVLHEGRHRVDARTSPSQSQADAEFRAKLDEVTGARLPRLALTAILSPTIGDSSPHGIANRRIMIGLNRWIRRNGGSIAGYDPLVPALLQLPKLTDAQLRAAFNSMRAP